MTSPVPSNNLLARYVVFSKWIHKSDQTLKQDAFMPDLCKRDLGERLETSVTRHLNLSDEDIWRIGKLVASKRGCTLHGRGDIEANRVTKPLRVVDDPESDNPNHAVIIDWPEEKNSRKMLVLEILRNKPIPLIPLPTEG